MKLKPLRKKHPKGFGMEFRSLDFKSLLKKRERNWFNSDHDFCVYGGKAPNGDFYYIGMGRYKDIDGEHCRAVSHNGDLLCFTITPEWECIIFCYGGTSLECHVIEAQLIKWSAEVKGLTKRGKKVGDAESMINKRHERTYERMIEEYLNLDGNNDWETLRREIYDY